MIYLYKIVNRRSNTLAKSGPMKFNSRLSLNLKKLSYATHFATAAIK